MAQNSRIEWTNITWNPVTGCTKVGPGCDNCYAERFANRWRGIKGHPYEQGFDLRLWWDRLSQPRRYKKPQMIFVNSMSDLFHNEVSQEFVDCIFDEMEHTDWHIYQILTKRSSLMRDYIRRRYGGEQVPQHIWLGVSVEDRLRITRIEHLKEIDCAGRFVSFEPLLGSIGPIDLSGIVWVIVGGESGPSARPMDKSWVVEIRGLCEKFDSQFFFKQWGGLRPKSNGRVLDGAEWNGYPWHAIPKTIRSQIRSKVR